MIQKLIQNFYELEENLNIALSEFNDDKISIIDAEITFIIDEIINYYSEDRYEIDLKFDFLLQQLCFGMDISPDKIKIIDALSDLYKNTRV